MSDEKFEDIEVYPPSASESGNNAFYVLGCKDVGHNAPYASCLKKIKDRANGRLDAKYADCSVAIGKRECQALKLQKEELNENQAIYFVNRKKLQAFNQYRDEMAAQQIQYPERGKKASKQERPINKPSPTAMESSDYASAINFAIQEESKKVEVAKPEPVNAVFTPQKAGMSLIEMARARQASLAV